MKTINISTDLTLFYKYLLPATFFAVNIPFLLFFFLNSSDGYFGTFPLWILRSGILSLLLFAGLLFYKTVYQLHRVEMDSEHVYISDYFTIMRYPFASVEKITEQHFLIFTIVKIVLIDQGKFGKETTFIAGSNYFEVLDEFPDFKALVQQKK